MTKQTRTKSRKSGSQLTTNNSQKTIKGDHEKVVNLASKIEKLNYLINSNGSSLPNRGNFGTLQGMGFDGDRDLYDSVGWNKEISLETYLSYYKRGVGRTVVNIKPDYTWNGRIGLREKGKVNSDLTLQWDKLERQFGITNIFNKADKLAGILQYSVILMGLDDNNASEPDKPVPLQTDEEGIPEKRNLLFLKVYRQDHADILEIDGNVSSPRFGKPVTYQIDTLQSETTNASVTPTNGLVVEDSNGNTGVKPIPNNVKTIDVDATRVVHIAENILEGEIYGTPRQEACMNYLQDLDKITGGSGEMYWRGALPGWFFSVDPTADYVQDDIDAMDTQIDNMLLGLERYIKAQGVTPTPLAPQISDPRPFVDTQYQGISATTRIPMRILIGSESGELASTQDADAWDSEIDSRRNLDCERWVRDLVDRFMAYGILNKVQDYEVVWPSINAQNEEQQSKIALNLSLALKNYTTSLNPDRVMPREEFLTRILMVPEDEARQIVEAIDETFKESVFEEDTESLESAEEKLKLVETTNNARLEA